MYDFNLLPSTAKKRSRIWLLQKHLSLGVGLANVLLVSVAVFLYAATNIIQSLQSEAEVRNNALMADAHSGATYSEQIYDINRSVQRIAAIQKSYVPYGAHLQDIAALVPEGVRLSSIDIEYDTQQIELQAIATDRTALQQMQTAIEESTFTLVSFPFDVFTHSEEIEFTVELELPSNE